MGPRRRARMSPLARRRAGSSPPLVLHYASLGTRVGLEDARAVEIVAYYRHVDRSGSLRGEHPSRSLGGSHAPTIPLAGAPPFTTRSRRRARATPLPHTRPRSQCLLVHDLALGPHP